MRYIKNKMKKFNQTHINYLRPIFFQSNDSVQIFSLDFPPSKGKEGKILMTFITAGAEYLCRLVSAEVCL